ncbi:fungal-specific transcription factor domain-domain-containing protein [Kockovaella imperatae]|uniref:Fungal-specific transcription factor domain-domain-containing protein n=1 Tax=Kockovaella imperatae TaxID=4999 RepID=A0A1Y1UIZ5_9TREE|nr:fungal-specific transcription factor domain-domain-containing protein [Kockovaella imperatae]ORX37075.1 fungal-specific transcription factor domain-domain-containing protein [Kockovaella imperatae]
MHSFLGRLASLPTDALSSAVEEYARTGSVSVVGSDTVDEQADSNLVDQGPSTSRFSYGVRAGGRISAHGPTSALFDERDEREFGLQTSHVSVSEDELSRFASARCAEERHNEILNVASGKLDFDGVSPDLAMHLLALHWNRQHFAFLISYRPLFTRDMACAGPYFSKLLLNAMFFSVSKFSTRSEVYDEPSDQKTAGKRFLKRVKELLGEALDQSSIPSIQAMLLMSSSLFALGSQSAAWHYHGIAVQMIFDMGLNYDSLASTNVPGGLTAEETEIRRRVVWAAFIYDKVLSLYQGRPPSFAEDRMHVPHRFLDMYEEYELWTPYAFPTMQAYPGAPARAISTFTSLCSLSVIMGRIITQIYAEKIHLDRPADRLQQLSTSLERWKEALPPPILFDADDKDSLVPPPHVLSLHSVYYTLVTLLHRPFVETGRLSDPTIVEISWVRCEQAAASATGVLTRYRQTFTLARAPFLISYCTFVAATIHVRIASQRGPSCEAARLLGICLESLQENSATNPGVKKMHATILSLMDKLNVHLAGTGNTELVGSTSNASVWDGGMDLSAIISSFGDGPMIDPSFTFDPSLLLSNVDQGHSQQQDPLYGFIYR